VFGDQPIDAGFAYRAAYLQNVWHVIKRCLALHQAEFAKWQAGGRRLVYKQIAYAKPSKLTEPEQEMLRELIEIGFFAYEHRSD
jgi:hypothetical protein